MSRSALFLLLVLLACASPRPAADPEAKEEATRIFQLGLSHATAGRSIEAEAYFRQSIDLDPDFLDGYLGLAGLFVDLGREKESMKIYEAALSRLGERPEIFEDRATAYERFGKLEEAIAELRRAVEIRSKMPDTPENRKWLEQDRAGIEALTKEVKGSGGGG